MLGPTVLLNASLLSIVVTCLVAFTTIFTLTDSSTATRFGFCMWTVFSFVSTSLLEIPANVDTRISEDLCVS